MKSHILWILVTLLSAAIFLSRPFLGDYSTLIIWNFLVQACLALSYDFLGGYGGELHLGHGTFFGIGAYISVACLIAGIPWWAVLICSASGGFILSQVIRPLLIPLRGATFAMTSLVILLFFKSIFRNLSEITGGVTGLSTPDVGTIKIWFSSGLILFIICFWIHDSLGRSRFGRALRAISDDPQAAEISGIPCDRLRGQALVLGSLMAATIGGVYPFQSGYVSLHSAFGLDIAMGPVVMVLLGGPGTRFGPLLGSLVYVGFQEWLWTHLSEGTLAILGLSLIIIGVFFPTGIVGLMRER